MRTISSILGFVTALALATTSFAAPTKAAASPKLSPAAVKKAYFDAYSNQSFKNGPFINFSGAAQKEFNSLRKIGGSDYPARIVRLPGNTPMAKTTAGIYMTTDGGNFLSIVQTSQKGRDVSAKKVLASGSQSESEDFSWGK